MRYIGLLALLLLFIAFVVYSTARASSRSVMFSVKQTDGDVVTVSPVLAADLRLKVTKGQVTDAVKYLKCSPDGDEPAKGMRCDGGIEATVFSVVLRPNW